MPFDIKLSIIIISYNTKTITANCLESVIQSLNQSPNLKKQSEIIVVDNNSKDQSLNIIKKQLRNKSIKYLIIKNNKNLGFAQANNQAIQQAKGEFLFLLNSDTIIQNQAIKQLYDSFKKFDTLDTSVLASHHHELDNLGIVAATLLNPDKSLQKQGGSSPNLFSIFCHMLLLDKFPIIGPFLPSTQHTGLNKRDERWYQRLQPNSKPRLIQKDWVSAAAMMIKKEVIETVGLMDENLFMYGEDMEFCLRAKNHHYDIAIHPQARIIHLGSASSSSLKALEREFSAYQYLWSKHKSSWQLPYLKFILKIGAKIRVLIFGKIFIDQKKACIYQKIYESF